MKHRYSKRHPSLLDVELYDRGRSLGRFKARNISLEGMFVETGPVDLCTNDLVDVSLTIDHDEITSHRFKGLIVHHSENGFGLMFRDYNPAFYRILRQLPRQAA